MRFSIQSIIFAVLAVASVADAAPYYISKLDAPKGVEKKDIAPA